LFVQTKDKVKELAQKFRDFRITVAEIHGDLLPYQRDIIMSEFRANRKRVLVASDVVARGIDVVQTSCVILLIWYRFLLALVFYDFFFCPLRFVVNYDVPHLHGTGSADCEIYLHRIGRAGRFGRAVHFIFPISYFSLFVQIFNMFFFCECRFRVSHSAW
jgi:ATP-dependent RNA helicase DDX19/DBP5